MTAQPLTQLFDLTGKAAIVTGGAMGIGQAIAARLAEAGAAVVIADINLDAASQTADQIKAKEGKAAAVQADAVSVADAEKVAATCIDLFGSVDILVNNAGIYPAMPAMQITEALWDKVIDVNLKSMFFYSQAAAKRMIESGRGGRIVNIASVDGLHPTGYLTHYDSSKGGAIMLTKALALELAQHRITVNAIAPGAIQTPGTQVSSVDEATLQGFLKRIPLGRQGEPDDIAKAVLFLTSGAADYMTGSIVVVDGGYLLS